MRHFLARALAVAGLAGGVLAPAAPRVLVPRARGPQRRAPHRRGARTAAVPLAAVAPRAQEEHLRARRLRAHHEPQRVHASLPPAARGVDAVAASCDNARGCYASLRLSRRARRFPLRALTLWAASPGRALPARRRMPQRCPNGLRHRVTDFGASRRPTTGGGADHRRPAAAAAPRARFRARGRVPVVARRAVGLRRAGALVDPLVADPRVALVAARAAIACLASLRK